ncbi:MAG: methyltransferase domain-containing protein [Pseudomonadota bacterium]
MAEHKITFNDGAAYERMMGQWSRLAADVFLEWLTVEPGKRWVDVGCGSGAFTETAIEACQPAKIMGFDPSEGQIAFARKRPGAANATFELGNAMELPLDDNSVDVATMALVLFFVPDPTKGIAEMCRVVAPGGVVAAYSWDLLNGGFPLHELQELLRAAGHNPPLPPSAESSRFEAMQALWNEAGLRDVEVREITVERTFENFDELWEISNLAPSIGPLVSGFPDAEVDALKAALRTRFEPGADGRITYSARANAAKGRV